MAEHHFMYDETEDTKTRFVGFISERRRYDLAITMSTRFYGKLLVHDLQTGRAAIIGSDDLKEEGYLESAFQLSPEEAEELHSFLEQLV